jgi:hypothetical protein
LVAKPVGTRTPSDQSGSWEIISPKLAFLPPTASTSGHPQVFKWNNERGRLKRLDIQDSGGLKQVATDVKCWNAEIVVVFWCANRLGRR